MTTPRATPNAETAGVTLCISRYVEHFKDVNRKQLEYVSFFAHIWPCIKMICPKLDGLLSEDWVLNVKTGVYQQPSVAVLGIPTGSIWGFP